MKLNKNKFILLLALAGLGMATPDAKAVTTAFTNDDLIVGFTNGTNSYVLNIGQASQFRPGVTPNGVSTLNLNQSAITSLGTGLDATYNASGGVGTISKDLEVAFGSNWFTDSTVKWGIVGTTASNVPGTNVAYRDPQFTLYASSTTATPGSSYNRSSTQSVAEASILGMTQGGGAGVSYTGNTVTSNSKTGLIEDNTYTKSWLSYQPGGANSPGGSSFGLFTSLNATLAGSTSTLDLFRIQPSGSGVTGGQGTTTSGTDQGQLLGTFSINSNGVINWNVAAVPEPSRALLMVGGLVGMLMRRRRQSASAVA